MNINATIFGQSIAFILFVCFCMKYVWPPIIAAIEKRQKEICEGLASVENAKKELHSLQIDIKKQLKNAKNEAQIIIEQANKLRLQILDEARAVSNAEHDRIILHAQEQIESERSRVCEELSKQVASLILAAAEKIIERSIDEATNRDIIDNMISKLALAKVGREIN